MKLTSALFTLATSTLVSLSAFAADEAGFKPLFDGKSRRPERLEIMQGRTRIEFRFAQSIG